MKIGVFDSGVGGLTVLSHLLPLPAQYIYIGDNKNAPYGNRSSHEIISLTSRLTSFLKDKNVSLYVSACNSISSQDTRELLHRQCIDLNQYIDMVSATRAHLNTVKYFASKVLIWATKATIETGVYQDIFSEKKIKYIPLVSEHLAEAIEKGDIDSTKKEIEICVTNIKRYGITHVFFGCTHFPHVKGLLNDALKSKGIIGIEYIDPALFVRDEVVHRIKNTREVISSQLEIYTTKNVSGYDTYRKRLEGGRSASITEIRI